MKSEKLIAVRTMQEYIQKHIFDEIYITDLAQSYKILLLLDINGIKIILEYSLSQEGKEDILSLFRLWK